MNAVAKDPVTIVNEISDALREKGLEVNTRYDGVKRTDWDGNLRVFVQRGEYVAQISSHYTNVLVQIVHDDIFFAPVTGFRQVRFESNDVDDIMSVITDWLFN